MQPLNYSILLICLKKVPLKSDEKTTGRTFYNISYMDFSYNNWFLFPKWKLLVAMAHTGFAVNLVSVLLEFKIVFYWCGMLQCYYYHKFGVPKCRSLSQHYAERRKQTIRRIYFSIFVVFFNVYLVSYA